MASQRNWKKNEDYFFEEVNQTKMLSREKTHDLIRCYQKNGSAKAIKEIVISHLRLLIGVGMSCRDYYRPEFITAEELVLPGIKGLTEAVQRFDVSRGVAFTTFARKPIFSKMGRYIRKHRFTVYAPEHAQREPMSVPGDALLSKVYTKEKDAEGEGVPEDVLWKPSEKQPERKYIMYHDVRKILLQLPERERNVLVYYTIFGKTLKEVGEVMRMSHENVRLTLKPAKDHFRSLYE